MNQNYKSDEHVNLTDIAIVDVVTAFNKDKDYGASWKKRGGCGAYMVMARKMDRLEEQVKKHNYDIFKALSDKSTSEALVDTLMDLRVYLLLIENEAIKLGIVQQVCVDHYYLEDREGTYVLIKEEAPSQLEVDLPERSSYPKTEHPAPFGFTPESDEK